MPADDSQVPRTLSDRRGQRWMDVIRIEHSVETTARCVLSLPKLAQGWQRVDVSVSHQGDVVVLMRTQVSDSTYRYAIQDASKLRGGPIELAATHERFDLVRRLDDSRFLLLRARATRSPADLNAQIFDCQGRRVAAFHAGDAVGNCQVSPTGRIYLGFAGEGIGADNPPGHSGLACVDDTGRLLGEYATVVERQGVPPIRDCYTLNVTAADDVWLCYAPRFPLVHLRGWEVADMYEKNPVRYPQAVAMAEQSALFARQLEGEQRMRLFHVSLSSMRVAEVIPQDAEGTLVAWFEPYGCASKLYLTAKSHVFALDANQVARQL